MRQYAFFILNSNSSLPAHVSIESKRFLQMALAKYRVQVVQWLNLQASALSGQRTGEKDAAGNERQLPLPQIFRGEDEIITSKCA